MNFYKPETVKRGVKLSRYLEDQGYTVSAGRCVAKWRDGQKKSVSIDDAKGLWHDHVAGNGGDVIHLFIMVEGGDFMTACRTLGDRYHLDPYKVSKKPPKPTRGEMLAKDGYRLVKSYEYTDEHRKPLYWVDRWEGLDCEGKKVKEFVQRGPNGRDLAGVTRTLYRLPELVLAERVFVCEGEKDADTLAGLGLAATTNSGGAKTWEQRFGAFFEGKDVIMMLDNDEAGQSRLDVVGGNIAHHAKSVKALTISKLPKGDVTDWIEKEGGTLDQLLEAVKAAKDAETCKPEVADAKLANKAPLRNYVVTEEWTDDEGRHHERRAPRLVDDICDEMATRFLGFPKVIGSVLFDYTRRDRRIIRLNTNDSLHAWMDGTSKHQSEFLSGVGYASYKSLTERLLQTRQKFDVIAHAPWFPAREDAFPAYEALPPPDAARTSFNELISFFLPATDADRTLMKAFFCAPMFYTPSARPAWIIDTVDAQASGKTTVVKACGWLYDEQPLKFDVANINVDNTRAKKEILSTEGREKRLVLFDNVTTSFKSQTLADMITSQSITGMAPYGRGTETRTNDITWCATVNGAVVDTDMATRSYVIHIRAPGADADPFWEKKLREFIDANRYQIQADIMDMMRCAKERKRSAGRFAEFDAGVLSAVCETDEEFEAADRKIREASEAANDDADLAAQFVEAMADALMKYQDVAGDGAARISGELPCVIRCTDVDEILRHTYGGVKNWTSRTVRKFVNGGHLPNVLKGVERAETTDGRKLFGRARCIVFAGNPDVCKRGKAQFVSFSGGVPRVVGIGNI